MFFLPPAAQEHRETAAPRCPVASFPPPAVLELLRPHPSSRRCFVIGRREVFRASCPRRRCPSILVGLVHLLSRLHHRKPRLCASGGGSAVAIVQPSHDDATPGASDPVSALLRSCQAPRSPWSIVTAWLNTRTPTRKKNFECNHLAPVVLS